MPRTDLFAPIHKAIRAQLFEQTSLAARTDFAEPEEAALAVQRLRELCARLEEHQGHEDAVVMPELRRLQPELFTELEHEHLRIGGLALAVTTLLDRFDGATASERLAIGQHLQHRLHRLVAAQLAHLEREEVEVNRVLWAHCSDAELQAMHGRIMGRIPPERAAEWLGLILPALSRPERVQLLSGLRQQATA